MDSGFQDPLNSSLSHSTVSPVMSSWTLTGSANQIPHSDFISLPLITVILLVTTYFFLGYFISYYLVIFFVISQLFLGYFISYYLVIFFVINQLFIGYFISYYLVIFFVINQLFIGYFISYYLVIIT